jgi:hypothetical protein
MFGKSEGRDAFQRRVLVAGNAVRLGVGMARGAARGHDESLARAIAETFRRRFRSGSGHPVRNVDLLILGHVAELQSRPLEARSGWIAFWRAMAAPNDRSWPSGCEHPSPNRIQRRDFGFQSE